MPGAATGMVPCDAEFTDAIGREAAQGRRIGRLVDGLEGGREAAEAEREELVPLAKNGFQELSLVPSASCHRRTDSKLVMSKHPCHVCNATWAGWGLGRALCCHSQWPKPAQLLQLCPSGLKALTGS